MDLYQLFHASSLSPSDCSLTNRRTRSGFHSVSGTSLISRFTYDMYMLAVVSGVVRWLLDGWASIQVQKSLKRRFFSRLIRYTDSVDSSDTINLPGSFLPLIAGLWLIRAPSASERVSNGRVRPASWHGDELSGGSGCPCRTPVGSGCRLLQPIL